MSLYRAYFVPGAMDPFGLERYETGPHEIRPGFCIMKVYENDAIWPLPDTQVASRIVPCIKDDDGDLISVDDIPWEDIVEIINQVVEDPNGNVGPGDIVSPTGILGDIVDDAAGCVETLAEDDCKNWYKLVKEALDKAAKGDGSGCAAIMSSRAGSPAAKCLALFTGKRPAGAVTWAAMQKLQQQLSSGCAAAARANRK